MKIILFALISLILSMGIIPVIPFSDAAEDNQICIDKVWIENTKGKIACVTPTTADKLVERGWGIILDDQSHDTMKKHHGWTSFTTTSDSKRHPRMVTTEEDHHMILALPFTDKVYKGIVSFDATEPIQLISMHGQIPDNEKSGQMVWTHPDDGTNVALTVEFPEKSMGSWLFTGQAMGLHILRNDTFSATYSVSYTELELSDTVKSETIQSIQDPGIGHENHQLAIILPPNEKIYSGVLSYTASESIQLVTLHGPLAEGDDRGQAIWTTDGETKYGLTFYEPETKIGTGEFANATSYMGTWVFSGNALAIHTMNEEPFTVSYTVAATLPDDETSEASSSDTREDIDALKSQIEMLQQKISQYELEQDTVQGNLDLFDELDLVAFNNRDMERIAEIHMPDVKVINRDGKVTEPFDPDHKAELEFLFNTFPDFSINEHTIGFGQGNWTAGLSISTGTFLNPMELPDGTVIEPTGESFEVRIVTLANWEDGRIVEEYLIWDNEDWMGQIGVE